MRAGMLPTVLLVLGVVAMVPAAHAGSKGDDGGGKAGGPPTRSADLPRAAAVPAGDAASLPAAPVAPLPIPGYTPVPVGTPPVSSSQEMPPKGVASAPGLVSGLPVTTLLPGPSAAQPASPAPGGSAFTGVVGFLQVQVNDPADARLLAAELGLTIHQVSTDQRVLSLAAPPGVDLTLLLNKLRGDPRVHAADLQAVGFVGPAH